MAIPILMNGLWMAVHTAYGKIDAAVIDDWYGVSDSPMLASAVAYGSLPLSLYSLGSSLLLMLNEDEALEEV